MSPSLRQAYFLPEQQDAVELRAFTHGLMPRTVPEMMRRFTEDWRLLGVDAWNEVPNHWLPESGERVGWWTLPEYLGDRFIAPLLSAEEGTCIMQPNVHWTVQCLLSSPDLFRHRREIVLTEAEFPSVGHSARRWADLLGLKIKSVPAGPDGFVDREAVLSAVGPETAICFLSHVGFTTGELLPVSFLAEAGRRVRAGGGLFAVDGYHATGSYPVDVREIGADVYFGGLLKEAGGSSGNAYVYVRPGLELSPTVGGWFGDARPFAFEPSPAPHPAVRRRFLGGTTPIAPLYHAVEGLRLLLAVGLENVRADSLEKTGQCIAAARRAGIPIRSPEPPERRSAMVILDVPHADRLASYLKRRHVYVDSRQGRYLRMAPFVWNTPEEIERAFHLIGAALRSGSYLHADENPVPADVGPVT